MSLPRSRGLGRLPTLRLDRRVDALDLVPENDVLVAGDENGTLSSRNGDVKMLILVCGKY